MQASSLDSTCEGVGLPWDEGIKDHVLRRKIDCRLARGLGGKDHFPHARLPGSNPMIATSTTCRLFVQVDSRTVRRLSVPIR